MVCPESVLPSACQKRWFCFGKAVVFVKGNRNRLLCLLLTISMLFSGMCPESLRADSFLDYTKTLAGRTSIDKCGSKLSEPLACTARMLGVRGLRAPQVFGRAVDGMGQREAKQLLVCLFLGIAFFLFFCFHITAQTMRFRKLRGMAVILDYIHKKDGKK